MQKKYIAAGRYMSSNEVVGYHIVSSLDGQQRRVTREQFIFMVGQGDILNCTGQLYADQVILRCTNGINMSELPVFDDNSLEFRKSSTITNTKYKGDNMNKIFEQLTLVARLMKGRDNIGFEVKNHGGQISRLSRDKIMELASNKLISNATVQNCKDKKILRGVGIDIRQLPVISISG